MVKILTLVVVFVLVAGFVIYKQENGNSTENVSPGIYEMEKGTEKLGVVEKNEEPRYKQPELSNSGLLDLSGQKLEKIPSSVFEKTDTEVLDLSHNQLTGALQAEIRHLTKLRTLDLSDNQFTGVPAEVGQLKNLETLDLSNNQLTGLPYELGNLKNLKTLDLRGNNYAVADLEIIKKNLPATTKILTD